MERVIWRYEFEVDEDMINLPSQASWFTCSLFHYGSRKAFEFDIKAFNMVVKMGNRKNVDGEFVPIWEMVSWKGYLQ